VPFIVAGRNDHIAWGLTTTHGDTQDIFVERLAEDDPEKYLTPEGPRRFLTREEVIGIRGEEAETVTLRETRHGPVISDVIPEAAETAESGTVLALAWPALRGDDRTGEALYRLNRAGNWDQFRAALENFHSPQQNFVYADVTGAIGVAIPARVPIRKRGDGRAPVPGWTGEYDWTGFVPFDELPIAIHPPAGRIVTANNKAVPDDYPHLIATDWPEPYRAQRIHELLDEGRGRNPESSLAIQQDSLSLAARELLPLLLTAEPENRRDRLVLALLAEWDGRMDRDRPEPLIFHAWLRELTRLILADELGPEFEDFQYPKPGLMVRVLRDGPVWCDNVETEIQEDCGTQLAAALKSALNGLALRFQSDPERLRWGKAHVARFSHPVYSRIPVLGDLIDYEVGADGGSFTINRAGVRFNGPEAGLFQDIHGPGYRAVYDLANLDNSRFMIATGQSGNPLSPHYGSLVARWRDGVYVKLVGAGKAPAARLMLTPGRAAGP
jgi:penicillin amidase